MLHKPKMEDVLICLLMVLQLGFQTNHFYDEDISFVITMIVGLYYLIFYKPKGKIVFSYGSKEYILWYLVFFGVCCMSLVTGKLASMTMFKKLIKNTLLPIIMSGIVFGKYLKNQKYNPTWLLELIVYAEVITCIRVLLYTPLGELISKLDTTLYGHYLGVNYNNFTTPLALVFCIVLYLNMFCKKKMIKSTIFIIINLIISGSRKAIVASIICAVLLYLLKTDRNHVIKKIEQFAKVGILVSVAVIIVYNNSYLRYIVIERVIRAISTLGKEYEVLRVAGLGDASSRVRAILREEAWETFTKYPVFGVGYYGFARLNQWGFYAHNNMLDILANLGIVGFVSYYWYYAYQFYVSFRIKRENKRIKNSSRPDILMLSFFVELLIIEYGQITYFRMFALLPILTVATCGKVISENEKVTQQAIGEYYYV